MNHMVIGEIGTILNAISIANDIRKKLFDDSSIKALKGSVEIWYSIAGQFKEDELVTLTKIGDSLKNIFERYETNYKTYNGIPLITYENQKFYMLTEFYWLENEFEEDIFNEIKEELNYDADDPYVDSFTLYLIPKNPEGVNVVSTMKKFGDMITKELLNSDCFNIYIPFYFLLIFTEEQNKLKADLLKNITDNIDDGSWDGEQYLQIMKPSDESIEKIIKTIKGSWYNKLLAKR